MDGAAPRAAWGWKARGAAGLPGEYRGSYLKIYLAQNDRFSTIHANLLQNVDRQIPSAISEVPQGAQWGIAGLGRMSFA